MALSGDPSGITQPVATGVPLASGLEEVRSGPVPLLRTGATNRAIAAWAFVHACALACALACAGCIACAARLTYAEIQFRRGTYAAVEQAANLVRFAPPAGYFERLADIDPERASQWLNAALEADPRLSSAWIAQGLASEHEGEHDGQFDWAERDLLQAARVNHRYLPAWTLVNFYFRRQRWDQFWMWARRAAALTYDDFRPLLALAHAAEPNPRVVLERLGGGESLLRADLDYLAEHRRFDDAQETARLLLARRDAAGVTSDAPRLLELAERQIRAGNAGYALELWNSAVAFPNAAALPNHERLDPEKGPVLANADLLRAPSGVAFDWRLPRTAGAIVAWQPSQLTFSLSGNQPESCALLEQIVPMTRARHYRLHFEYLTSGLASPTGIIWDLDGDEGPALKPSEAWLGAAVVLHTSVIGTPDGLSLGRLRLLYRREPGTVRVQGRLELRHLRMEVL